MSELAKVSTIKPLQLSNDTFRIRMTKGQISLLKLMNDLIEKGHPLRYEDIVRLYYFNISKIHRNWKSIYEYIPKDGKLVYTHTKNEYNDLDILNQFTNDTNIWRWYIRPKVRTWFTQNIGTLVLKGKLMVLPIIEIED